MKCQGFQKEHELALRCFIKDCGRGFRLVCIRISFEDNGVVIR